MRKPQEPPDPLGNYVGYGCHNCINMVDFEACLIRLELYDDNERTDDDYIGRLNDVCPDWSSRYVPGYRRRR